MSEMKITARSAGSTVNKNALAGVDVKTNKVFTGNSEYEELTPDESININIGVFFDGTLNNRYNVNARKAYEKKQRGERLSKQEEEAADTYAWFFGLFKQGGSFANEESNISKMEPYYKDGKIDDKTIQIPIYIEGIGTEDGESDNTLGKGLGKGTTGIRAKVKKACEKAAEEIKRKTRKSSINTITVDAFGFSRGAAAARHFIYEITKPKGHLSLYFLSQGFLIDMATKEKTKVRFGLLGKKLNKDEEIKMLSVRHVGLFDTVTAVGYPFNHESNIRNLHLDSITKARSVFQIASGDEHRSNFKLTNIESVRLTTGVEKIFPGVHSDIGGGYRDQMEETVNLTGAVSREKAMIEKARLIEQGWYQDPELKLEPAGSMQYSDSWRLIGTRTLSNKYSDIPLHIMAEYAKEKKVKILVSDLIKDYKIKDSLLMAAKNILTDYVFNNGEALSYANEKYRPFIKALRHKYFHWSADYGSFGMSPHIENGKRQRIVFDDINTKK